MTSAKTQDASWSDKKYSQLETELADLARELSRTANIQAEHSSTLQHHGTMLVEIKNSLLSLHSALGAKSQPNWSVILSAFFGTCGLMSLIGSLAIAPLKADVANNKEHLARIDQDFRQQSKDLDEMLQREIRLGNETQDKVTEHTNAFSKELIERNRLRILKIDDWMLNVGSGLDERTKALEKQVFDRK